MLLGKEILVYLSIKYQGDFEKMMGAIKRKDPLNEEEVKGAIKSVKSHYLTILDDEYPNDLKQIAMPPLVLFYYGDISLLNNKDIKRLGVVGSRENSRYGEDITRSIVKDIAKEVIIVSGLARGIDAIAHEETINNNGKTIAVLGCGIDYIYPKENDKLFKKIKESHLLISEYPNETKPNPNFFPMRNRLIAGFSNKLLVTEAYQKSGTNITVLFALKQGKDILAVPYQAQLNSSCNKLIQDGAFLVENSEDVLYYLK